MSNVDKLSNPDEVPVRLCNYVDVYKNDRITLSLKFMRATATPLEVERFRLQKSDVLITKDSESWNDIGVPALVEEAADDLLSGYHLALLRPSPARVIGEYLFRALQSAPVAQQFHVEAKGVTRYGLAHAAIKSVLVPVPPLPEQRAIIRFLDHVDRRIRRYVRAKQKLIRLLEEQKQAIIHRAVTRGLDPNDLLKPSGVEWLGDVPQHWTVASLRFRYDQCLGKMVDAKKASGKYLVPYLRNVDVRWDRINVQDLPLIDIAPTEYQRYTVQAGDLLVCEGRHLGRAAFWREELPLCGFQKALHRLRPRDAAKDHSRFLYYCLYLVHVLDAFGASSADNSIPHLTGEMLRAHRFPFPPAEEQRSIASFLDHEVSDIERVQEKIESQILCAREFRTRLIADVVTGKIDVRVMACRLPETDESHGPASADSDGDEVPELGETRYAEDDEEELLEVAEGEE